jgi:hypothetical protein
MGVSNLADWTTHSGLPIQSGLNAMEATPAAKTDLNAEDKTGFFPDEPLTREETGLSATEIESLILKLLLNCGLGTGRAIAHHIRLPFAVIKGEMLSLKTQLLVSYRDGAPMGDYEYELTELGYNYFAGLSSDHS